MLGKGENETWNPIASRFVDVSPSFSGTGAIRDGRRPGPTGQSPSAEHHHEASVTDLKFSKMESASAWRPEESPFIMVLETVGQGGKPGWPWISGWPGWSKRTRTRIRNIPKGYRAVSTGRGLAYKQWLFEDLAISSQNPSSRISSSTEVKKE